MKISDKFICNNPECNNINEWEYIIEQEASARNYYVETLDHNKLHPMQANINKAQNDYRLTFRCDSCNHVNTVYYPIK